MKIQVSFSDDNPEVVIELPNEAIDDLMKKYPQIWNLRATEELAELQMALSKVVRHDGQGKTLDNLIEESVDTLCTLLMLLRKYYSPEAVEKLQKYSADKPKKFLKQMKADEAVFKADTAKLMYANASDKVSTDDVYNHMKDAVRNAVMQVPENALMIRRGEENGEYLFSGDTDSMAEFWYALSQFVRSNDNATLQRLLLLVLEEDEELAGDPDNDSGSQAEPVPKNCTNHCHTCGACVPSTYASASPIQKLSDALHRLIQAGETIYHKKGE